MMDLKKLVQVVGEQIIANKEFLTELDQAIGDGDHGINMARGFEFVEEKLASTPEDIDASTLLKQVGMVLISKVGGASGPLYGTAFMRASAACKDKALSPEVCAAMLDAAITGIQNLGKAQAGEKTMLDALIPASKALHDGIVSGKNAPELAQAVAQAAQEGVDYTKTIIATKGRAAYVGERSLGHQDAGATSSTIMLEAVADYLGGKN